MTRRGWWLVLAAATGLALASLASNVTTMSQLSGEADAVLVVRATVSKLVNSGAVWAGLAVLSGWLVRRPAQAFAAGIVACLLALVAHYGVGRVLGLFDSDVWTENSFWFVAALVLGGPLGLVGAVARRPDLWGLVARLLIPAAAVLEPFVVGMFTSPAIMPWPGRVSSFVSAMILLGGGTAGGIKVLVAARKKHLTRDRRATADM